MADVTENRGNWPAWSALLLALAAVLCNLVPFADLPGQKAIPWLSLGLALLALVLLAIGVQRVFRRPRIFRGGVLSSLVCLFALVLGGMAILGFFHSRELPRSAAAPQVGQKAPDFTLPDTNSHLVSLHGLFAPVPGDRHGIPSRAVLLVFYRGYW